MIARWCFQCGLDYSSDVAECVECAVPTVEHPPMSLDEVAADGGAQVAYELHGWNPAARLEVELELKKARLVHAWQGPTLIVRESDEELIDDIIGSVDDRMATSLSDGIESETGHIGFDLGMRNAVLAERVISRLLELGIDHEMASNGFLLVEPADEEEVGDVIEDVQAELGNVIAASFGPGLDGVEAHAVVEAMFLAADGLRRHPREARLRHQLVEAEAQARQLTLPFGYEASMWRTVLDRAALLVAHLDDDSMADEPVEQEALVLRSILHAYV